ncbi:MAG: YitT family protein [Rikenellaceae bacterium]|jgi:uncharacterized membrane-anchored protein YitT (DUF2179 family)|nr:YitT family protein [Rikenellaceae bacterium]
MAVKRNFGVVLREYAIITIGIILYALSWIIFLIPNNLVGGGVTGISSIVQYATNGTIKMGYTYFVVNAILLIIGLSSLGKSFGIKTVYAIIVASVLLSLGSDVIPQGFIQALALDNGKLLCVIIGGMISGFGIGLTMSQGGSTGGTDIIALLLNKKYGFSPGQVILWLDVVIIASSLLIPSYMPDGTLMPLIDKVMVVIYGYLLVAVFALALDWTIAGSKQSVQIFITSKHYAEIADEITNEFHRGVTVLNGKGWYTKQDTNVLMVLTRKADSNMLLRSVKSIDPDAFVSVSLVAGVYGRGFEQFKSPKETKGIARGKTKSKSK